MASARWRQPSSRSRTSPFVGSVARAPPHAWTQIFFRRTSLWSDVAQLPGCPHRRRRRASCPRNRTAATAPRPHGCPVRNCLIRKGQTAVIHKNARCLSTTAILNLKRSQGKRRGRETAWKGVLRRRRDRPQSALGSKQKLAAAATDKSWPRRPLRWPTRNFAQGHSHG